MLPKYTNISRLFVHSFANTIFTCLNFFPISKLKLKYNCASVCVSLSMGCAEHPYYTCKCNNAFGGFLWPFFPSNLFVSSLSVYMLLELINIYYTISNYRVFSSSAFAIRLLLFLSKEIYTQR